MVDHAVAAETIPQVNAHRHSWLLGVPHFSVSVLHQAGLLCTSSSACGQLSCSARPAVSSHLTRDSSLQARTQRRRRDALLGVAVRPCNAAPKHDPSRGAAWFAAFSVPQPHDTPVPHRGTAEESPPFQRLLRNSQCLKVLKKTSRLNSREFRLFSGKRRGDLPPHPQDLSSSYRRKSRNPDVCSVPMRNISGPSTCQKLLSTGIVIVQVVCQTGFVASRLTFEEERSPSKRFARMWALPCPSIPL